MLRHRQQKNWPPVVEAPPAEELAGEEVPLEEEAGIIPAVPEAPPPPAPVVEAPPAVPETPALEAQPAPAVGVVPPPASALSEEESQAVPPPVTASMFPEPRPGTFMKRPSIKITAPFEYIVKDGDDLHFLAARFYGNARLWIRIFEANRKVLGDNPNSLTRGIKLIIPSVE